MGRGTWDEFAYFLPPNAGIIITQTIGDGKCYANDNTLILTKT